MSSEGQKRDTAMARVAGAVSNNYELIASEARRWLTKNILPGTTVVSGQIFKAVMARQPHLRPNEKRVMGPVMRRLEKENLVIRAGISTREREHRGFAREWKRTRTMH